MKNLFKISLIVFLSFFFIVPTLHAQRSSFKIKDLIFYKKDSISLKKGIDFHITCGKGSLIHFKNNNTDHQVTVIIDKPEKFGNEKTLLIVEKGTAFIAVEEHACIRVRAGTTNMGDFVYEIGYPMR